MFRRNNHLSKVVRNRRLAAESLENRSMMAANVFGFASGLQVCPLAGNGPLEPLVVDTLEVATHDQELRVHYGNFDRPKVKINELQDRSGGMQPAATTNLETKSDLRLDTATLDRGSQVPVCTMRDRVISPVID